jgi:hypothetical protein
MQWTSGDHFRRIVLNKERNDDTRNDLIDNCAKVDYFDTWNANEFEKLSNGDCSMSGSGSTSHYLKKLGKWAEGNKLTGCRGPMR